MDQIFQIVEAPILSHKVKMDSQELFFFFFGSKLKIRDYAKITAFEFQMFLTTIK